MLLHSAKILLPVVSAAIFLSAESADAAAYRVICHGEHSQVTLLNYGIQRTPLLIAKYRDEWAIANDPTEMVIESNGESLSVRALASPIPDGSIEFITIRIPQISADRSVGSIEHSREYTYLDNDLPRTQSEELTCQGGENNADGDYVDIKKTVSGTVMSVSMHELFVKAGTRVHHIHLDRPPTVIMDGYDMAGTDVLGTGTPVEVFLGDSDKVLLIHATRDVPLFLRPASYDLVCRSDDPFQTFQVYLIYETWAGGQRNFMRMIETGPERAWKGEASTLQPIQDADGSTMEPPMAIYSARGPALYQRLKVTRRNTDGTFGGSYRRVARAFTPELSVSCYKN